MFFQVTLGIVLQKSYTEIWDQVEDNLFLFQFAALLEV
jgi:hypothetical protein